LSQKWDEVMEGMNIVNRDVSAQDVQLSIHYFKLRKLKKMLEENQRDMETATGDALMSLIMIHKQLKEFEQQITSQLGTVILK
ncbi:MAG TPA: DNA primase, partial [Chitinophagaceae bacterium]|nr:DNA primase [Chitinophagaceae bacterium]